ncbi:hypothetical protein CFN78_27770 [Amycolatopsis antarctica]|uniref:Resolvase/invertase-type recombinase catalytic domain-containing protein n=1 Tax=Amycolatopsis antarctica TaxID=1854586 RepID=A0A263CVE9_9PSEU|nr:hypothetical protein [Amycolatopsis antarctica]OZM69949.1 hypothetical protein CFN78_27770 [Amycolatopsis antarctica]
MPENADDGPLRQTEQALRGYAEQRGFCFPGIFFEFQPGAREGFGELMRELFRADAHHVIVPNLGHLASHALLRRMMILQLAATAGAGVLALDAS